MKVTTHFEMFCFPYSSPPQATTPESEMRALAVAKSDSPLSLSLTAWTNGQEMLNSAFNLDKIKKSCTLNFGEFDSFGFKFFSINF